MPVTAAAIVGGTLVGVGLTLGGPYALAAIGFGKAGIAAGSTAAGMMSASAIANGGGVAAGSVVATCQSIGAAGFASGTQAAVAAGTAIIAAI